MALEEPRLLLTMEDLRDLMENLLLLSASSENRNNQKVMSPPTSHLPSPPPPPSVNTEVDSFVTLLTAEP